MLPDLKERDAMTMSKSVAYCEKAVSYISEVAVKFNSKTLVLLLLVIHLVFAILTKLISNWVPLDGFLIFAAAFAVLLISTVYIKKFHVLVFFNIFVYLGFYLKFCFHLVIIYPFAEPIGAFTGTAAELNEFFTVSAVAAIAISLASIVAARFFNKRNDKQGLNNLLPSSYGKYYKYFFWILLFAIVFVAVINLKLGINISGLAAVTILPRPLNALISFFLYMGFSVLIAVYALVEYEHTKKLRYTIALVLLEGCFSAVSILSRGIFLFHFLPFLICLYLYRKELILSIKNIFLITSVGAMCFVISGFLVTNARSALYDGYNLNSSDYITKNIFNFSLSVSMEEDDEGKDMPVDVIWNQNQNLSDMQIEKLEKIYENKILLQIDSLEIKIAEAMKSIDTDKKQKKDTEALRQRSRSLNEQLMRFKVNQMMAKRRKISIRLEVLAGGIGHVKQLIKNGEKQESYLKVLEQERNQLIDKMTASKFILDKYVIFDKIIFSKNNTHEKCDFFLCKQILTYATQISGLAIDRWIGAEGLMAVISYPRKNLDLIYKSLIRVPKAGVRDIFEEMNKSFYPISDKYVFTSLPGPIAFFYYSNSVVIVFFGLFGFVLLLASLQQASFFLIRNIFLQLHTAFLFSINFMQFGISPRPLLVSFIMLFSLLIAIRLLSLIIKYLSVSEELKV